MATRRWEDPEPTRLQRSHVRYARPAQVVLTVLATLCLASAGYSLVAGEVGRTAFYLLLTFVFVMNLLSRRQVVERVRRWDAEHDGAPADSDPPQT